MFRLKGHKGVYRALGEMDIILQESFLSDWMFSKWKPSSGAVGSGVGKERLASRPRSLLFSSGARGVSSGVDGGHSYHAEDTLRWYSDRAHTDDAGWRALQESLTSILVDVEDDSGVATITINRPEALNALNTKVMEELVSTALFLDREHPSTRVIVITGKGDKAFAAGADIKEMSKLKYAEAYNTRLLNGWGALRSVRKPMIAAINGYALGGGCELALMCDIAIAADTASLGQPEITLGVIPGMGGTQRLTKAVGKSRAMELILTGARVSASEAAKMGLISRAVPAHELRDEVHRVASKIASYSLPVISKAKECVNASFEMSLNEGLKFEKHLFWGCFGLQDQSEGMIAFTQKRKPSFVDS